MVQKSNGREHNKSERPWMKDVKNLSHRKDRQAVREALSHERYDDIPKNQSMKEEDPWGWD